MGFGQPDETPNEESDPWRLTRLCPDLRMSSRTPGSYLNLQRYGSDLPLLAGDCWVGGLDYGQDEVNR